MSQEPGLNRSEVFMFAQKLDSLACEQMEEGDVVKAIMENLLEGVTYHVFILNRKGTVVWSNSTLEKNYAYHPEGRWSMRQVEVGQHITRSFRVAAAMGNGAAAEVLSGINSVLQGRCETFDMDCPCIQDDSLCWFHIRISHFTTEESFIVSYRDISETKKMEYELRRCRQLLDRGNRRLTERFKQQIYLGTSDPTQRQAASVFHYSSEAVVITDDKLTIINVNEGFLKTTGYDIESVTGQSIHRLWPDDARGGSEKIICDAVRDYGHWQGELQLRRSNDEPFHVWGAVDVVFDRKGQVESYIFVFTDITPIKRSQARSHYMAHHDPLTGLANRLLFWARIEQSIAHAARHGKRIALVFVDIDEFKAVNDNLGHPVGDAYLKQISRRLTHEVRGEDTVARLGGDEFGLIVEEVSSPEDVITFINKLKNCLSERIEIEGQVLYPSASVGFGIYPEDGSTPESLYEAADRSMYRTKASRRKQPEPA